MKFSDYSPPSSPSLDQQRDALHKGLGRALQWAFSGCLDDKPLLEACLRDQRFDAQIDGPRGDWLWRMIQSIGAADRFRVSILHALYDLADERSAIQLCQFARHYADAGDETFRSRLYEIVEHKPVAYIPWLGEEEVIALDGEAGFLFAAGVRGRGLANREWDGYDGHLLDHAVERFGENQVMRLLDNSTDKAVKVFVRAWNAERENKAGRKPFPSRKDRMRAITVQEIVSEAEAEGPRLGIFRGWGMYADPADLERVLQRLWSSQNQKVIANLLRVFSNRALQHFDARLIDLCQHTDADVKRMAFNALEKNVHPLIREFALAELRKGMRTGSLASLFINNYQAGDEERMLEAMQSPDDECELHWLLMDVIKVLEQNPEADCSRLGIVAYALTPCENCRLHTVRLLLSQQVAPEWLKEECLHDSCEDCRQLAAKKNMMEVDR